MIVPELPVPSHPSHGVLDSTKIQAYQDCPRRFFYEYILGWRPAMPNNHLVFGSAVHKAMEHLILHGYTVNAVKDALEMFNDEYRAEFSAETDVLYEPKTPARFFSALLLYIRQYADDHLRFQVYKTEFGGTVHISERHVLAYKMDTILFNTATGKYFSLEHKTTASNYINKSYHIDHMMGIQVGTYTHVLNCLFHPSEVEGITINCMCFKRTKQPDFIFERFPIFMSSNQMYIWIETTNSWCDRIQEDYNRLAESSDSDPILKAFPCNGRSCSNWGKICPFQELCVSWANPLQHIHFLPADMQVEFWNPLEEDLREVITL